MRGRRGGRSGGALAAAALALALLAGRAAAQTDTAAVHVEAGVSSDFTNEQFYEEEVINDTTFLGRRLDTQPEARTAAVVMVQHTGTGAGGRFAYQFRNELLAGDKQLRLESGGALRRRAGDAWRLAFEPELEFLRDRSFGADRRESRARTDGRLTWSPPGAADALELLAGGEWFRTSGTSDFTLLDRNAARARLRWLHVAAAGDWELGYGADARTFPDSLARDHVEQHGEAGVHWDLPGAVRVAFDGGLERRTPTRAAPTTEDRFWSGTAAADLHAPLAAALGLEARLELEGYRYDAPDTVLYFDYDLWRARAGLRWDLNGGWSVLAGPRYERLVAPAVASERYHELAGALEFERLGASTWWSLEPAGGWRLYDLSTAEISRTADTFHSSYLFAEVQVLADQALPGALRLRLVGLGRVEQHEDPSQDARSLYFSLDLRRLF